MEVDSELPSFLLKFSLVIVNVAPIVINQKYSLLL
jgi:hypothetical protein